MDVLNPFAYLPAGYAAVIERVALCCEPHSAEKAQCYTATVTAVYDMGSATPEWIVMLACMGCGTSPEEALRYTERYLRASLGRPVEPRRIVYPPLTSV